MEREQEDLIRQRKAGNLGGRNFNKNTESFAFKSLEKMGWEQGSGLGKRGDGVTEAMKVKQLKEGQGLGASTERTSNSWMVNVTGFAGVLAKLNKKYGGTPEKETQTDGKESEKAEEKNQDEDKLISRNSLMYSKRAKHKDMRSYSVEDLTAIMGGNLSAPIEKEEEKGQALIGGMFVKSTKGDLKNLDVFEEPKEKKEEAGCVVAIVAAVAVDVSAEKKDKKADKKKKKKKSKSKKSKKEEKKKRKRE